MKNSLFFGIVWLGLATSNIIMATISEQDLENITAAVKTSDLEKVENFLSFHILSVNQKKSLLKEATIILSEKEQNVKFLNNPGNSVKATIGGTLLATLGSLPGAVITVLYLQEENGLKRLKKKLFIKGNRPTQFFCLSMPLSLIAGIYLINKGLSYATTVGVCNDAEKIKELIEQAQID